MPELPEVETIRRGLAEHLTGRTVETVEGEGSRLVRNNPGGLTQLKTALLGARIKSVERRGKFMWLVLDGPAEEAMVIHLGMSGQVRTARRPRKELDRHEHLRLRLSDGSYVRFFDVRMFGHLTVTELGQDPTGRWVPSLALHIAPDLLELKDRAAILALAQRFEKSQRAVKTMLLDQRLTSGVGNIYADEALFRTRTHGAKTGKDLGAQKLTEVLVAARDVMGQAVKAGGTSFDELYVDVDGNPGYFERELRVYGRKGRACRDCGTPIARLVIGGRSHFFCPTCQPEPK